MLITVALFMVGCASRVNLKETERVTPEVVGVKQVVSAQGRSDYVFCTSYGAWACKEVTQKTVVAPLEAKGASDDKKEFLSSLKKGVLTPSPLSNKAPEVIVYFDFDSDVLSLAEAEKVKTFLSNGGFDKDVVVTIAGFTDKVGAQSYNDELARRRAEAVRWFINQHFEIPLSNIRFDGAGKCCYVSSEDAKNRRAEILVSVKREAL